MKHQRGTWWVGTSGWQYKHWRQRFYPAGLPTSDWFAYYATMFDTVEINNTFYRLPEASTVREWRRVAPPGFLFAWKASRYLTHYAKLTKPARPLGTMLRRAQWLGDHLGPILVQLPPHWKRNHNRLES
jgi:uncharacterized protein YecE (DUF72 family)